MNSQKRGTFLAVHKKILQAFNDMNNKEEFYSFEKERNSKNFYQAGVFWKAALTKIENQFNEHGISKFRSNETNLSFFVPTYGCPGNGFNFKTIEKLYNSVGKSINCKQKRYLENKLNGYDHALSDYRAFKIANLDNDHLGLLNFSESKLGNPIEHFRFESNWFSRSSLNYLLGLSFLLSVDPCFKPKKILEIGGGFGSLAEILAKSNYKQFKYLDLDLPIMANIAKEYISNCFKDSSLVSVTDHTLSKKFTFDNLEQMSFLPNWRIEDLHGSIDLFVNFISFQEMEPSIVENYISHVQRLSPKWVLLRNMREGKQLATDSVVGVEKQITTENYLEYFSDYELVKSSVLEYGFETVDGYSSELMVLKIKNL